VFEKGESKVSDIEHLDESWGCWEVRLGDVADSELWIVAAFSTIGIEVWVLVRDGLYQGWPKPRLASHMRLFDI
jgi:hypothetical protein